MRTELYTLVFAEAMLLGGCAQVIGIEDLPPLVDAATSGDDRRLRDAGIPDAAAGFPDGASPDASPDAGEGEVDLERGLAGHWPLDEIESGSGGNTTPDHTDNRFDGEVDGTSVVAGQVGMALRFDGSDDSVRIGNRPELDIAGPITLSAWGRPAVLDQNTRNIVAHGSTSSPRREVFLRLSNEQYQGGSWDGADHKAVSAIPANDLGGWIHLATVYDGQDWVLYRNGTEVGREPSPTGAVTVDESWFIGDRLSESDRFFDGDIDDVRIYDRALSPAEVRALATP